MLGRPRPGWRITERRWEAYSQALLSADPKLQEQSHYNLGNTLYQRGEGQKVG